MWEITHKGEVVGKPYKQHTTKCWSPRHSSLGYWVTRSLLVRTWHCCPLSTSASFLTCNRVHCPACAGNRPLGHRSFHSRVWLLRNSLYLFESIWVPTRKKCGAIFLLSKLIRPKTITIARCFFWNLNLMLSGTSSDFSKLRYLSKLLWESTSKTFSSVKIMISYFILNSLTNFLPFCNLFSCETWLIRCFLTLALNLMFKSFFMRFQMNPWPCDTKSSFLILSFTLSMLAFDSGLF